MGGDFLRKRIVKVKISQEQMTLLRLKSAITDLSDELGDSTKKPYKVTVRKIPPVETDLVTVGKINNTIKFEVREKESHHNEAHFHITIRGQGSGSYRISDFTAIESNIPRKPANKKSSPKWDLLQGNLAEGGEKEVQHK